MTGPVMGPSGMLASSHPCESTANRRKSGLPSLSAINHRPPETTTHPRADELDAVHTARYNHPTLTMYQNPGVLHPTLSTELAATGSS